MTEIKNDRVRHYPAQDPRKLEPHFSKHVLAMTVERLHDKSAIAEQLAWRDQELEALRTRVAELEKALDGQTFVIEAQPRHPDLGPEPDNFTNQAKGRDNFTEERPSNLGTERAQLEAMFSRAGIIYRVGTPDDARFVPNQLRVFADDNNNRHSIEPGYSGFESMFTFDEAGALLQLGSWE